MKLNQDLEQDCSGEIELKNNGLKKIMISNDNVQTTAEGSRGSGLHQKSHGANTDLIFDSFNKVESGRTETFKNKSKNPLIETLKE